MNPIVPMIPQNLSGIIGSPFGALIGIHSKIWTEYWEESYDIISDDAYVLFLNKNEIICENDLEEIPFYEELNSNLLKVIDVIHSNDANSKNMTEWKILFEKAGITREINKNDILVYAQLKLKLEFFYVIFWRIYKNIDLYIDFDKN